MPREQVLSQDTILYSDAEPKGRKFPAGEQWPGDAWSEQPGGAPKEKRAASNDLRALADAHSEIERLTSLSNSQTHDLGQLADERDGLKKQIAGLKKAAEEAAAGGTDDRKLADDARKARDDARADAEGQKQRAAKLEADLTAAKATIERVTAELQASQQGAADSADLRARIQELETEVANAAEREKALQADLEAATAPPPKAGK